MPFVILKGFSCKLFPLGIECTYKNMNGIFLTSREFVVNILDGPFHHRSRNECL